MSTFVLSILELFFLGGVVGLIASLFTKKVKKYPFVLVAIISILLLFILSAIFNFNTFSIFSKIYGEVLILAFLGGIAGFITSIFNKEVKKKPFILLVVVSIIIFFITVIYNFPPLPNAG